MLSQINVERIKILKIIHMFSIAALPLMGACTTSSMTTGEITALYADTTNLSNDKSSSNYYGADGLFKSTKLETGVAPEGKWYAKEPDQICVHVNEERCWSMSKSGSSVSFKGSNGQTGSRSVDEYLPGDQTAELMAAAG